MLATLIIRPAPWRTISAPTALAQWKTPIRFTSTIRRNSSGARSRAGLRMLMPGTLKAMSIRPSPAAASPAIASTLDQSVTSTRIAVARRPSSRAVLAVDSTPPRSMSATATSAPKCASPSAIARPMPPAAPVTSAVRPRRSNSDAIRSRVPLVEGQKASRVESSGEDDQRDIGQPEIEVCVLAVVFEDQPVIARLQADDVEVAISQILQVRQAGRSAEAPGNQVINLRGHLG